MASSFTVVVNDRSGKSSTDLAAALSRSTDFSKDVIMALAAYLEAMATGIGSPGDVNIDLSSAALVQASATVTCASVAEADTVTIAGYTLTAQDLREKFTVLCVADVASSLNDTYFTFSTPSTNYYVWFNVDDAGTDPEIEGKTGVEVAISEDDANTVVAAALQTALDALSGVTATVNSATVTVTADATGAATNAADGAEATGFTITVTRQGAASPDTAKFSMNTSNTAAGASLASAINAHTSLKELVVASANSGVVTIRCLVKGQIGNAITLTTSNGTRLAATGSGRLAGGTGGSTSTGPTVHSFG